MKLLLIFSSIFLFTGYAQAEVKTLLQAEIGAVWQAKNDVQIPPESGTYLEFDKFNQGPFPHYRLEGEVKWGSPHGVRFLLAPFRVSVTGRAPQDVNYRDEIYVASEDIQVNYMFDSYRVGYFYEWNENDSQMFRFGGTAKIRNAKIELLQGDKKKSYTNTGFVPLFYVAYAKALSENWLFHTDMDFSAAPQGRAFDLSVKAKRWIAPNRQWGAGFRTIEGGADNDKVVTWSWFHYLVLDYAVVW